MPDKPLPPYIGAAYYPEAWPEGTIDQDIERAKEIGINTFRIGEFAWSRMEREEGQHDFGWVHDVVNRLGEEGFAVIMATPTATPPAWLTKKYPEVLAVDVDGQPYGHGGRRHGCPASPKWRALSEGIVRKMADEFADDPHIIGWQIDNEFGCHVNESFSASAVARWREWLKEKYGTLDSLNSSWGTELWSQWYTDWDEIPAPVKCGYAHHPSLRVNWKEFSSDMYAECNREQYDILKAAGCPNVMTDGMPNFHRLDYETMFADADLVANNCYFPPDQYRAIIGECDWMRPIKDTPYWFTESATGWTGGFQVGSLYLPKPGSIRARGWLMTALGGEMVLYWLYRQHWSGQEMLHGSLLTTYGEPTVGCEEIGLLAEELQTAGEFLRETSVPQAKVALHYHTPSAWILDTEPQVPGLQYDSAFNESFHGPITDMNVMRDVLFAGADVSGYDLIFSPFMAYLPDDTLERMLDAVRAGATWVVGPLTSIRSRHATLFRDCAYGPIERALPFKVTKRFPATGIDPDIVWTDPCIRGKAKAWCDVIEPDGGATDIYAIYESGPCAGQPAAVDIELGEGRIIVLGFRPDPADTSWLQRFVSEAGVKPVCDATEGIAVVPRVGDKQNGWIAFDWKGLGGHAVLPSDGVDILTDEPICPVVSLCPYGVAVVKSS